jgi:hypothetical protein
MLALVPFLLSIALLLPGNIQTSPLNSPVTALALGGNGQLYIGQETILSEATALGNTLTLSRSVDLKRGTIVAIAPTGSDLLVLSEDGLSLLDASFNTLNVIPGGGQRLTLVGNRVYVAALFAGVRVFEIMPTKQLQLLGVVKTGSAAEDVSASADAAVWVAERDQGVRLYDLRNPLQPIVTLWAKELVPARRLLVLPNRLLVGYANKVALLDVAELRSPRLLGEITLDETTAFAGILRYDGTRVMIGRVGQSGTDFIVYDTANLTTLAELARFGETGAGEHLVLRNTDVFLGSERYGLRWVQLKDRAVRVVAQYPADPDRIPCGDKTPIHPEPPNLSMQPNTGRLTLRWSAQCLSRAYLLKIEGQADRQLTTTEFTLDKPPELLHWQVIALEGDQHLPGERWQVELERAGLIASPSPLPVANTLYVAPVGAFLDTPGGVLLATCAASLVGLGVIVGGALLIGAWSARWRAEEF